MKLKWVADCPNCDTGLTNNDVPTEPDHAGSWDFICPCCGVYLVPMFHGGIDIVEPKRYACRPDAMSHEDGV